MKKDQAIKHLKFNLETATQLINRMDLLRSKIEATNIPTTYEESLFDKLNQLEFALYKCNDFIQDLNNVINPLYLNQNMEVA
ncbi:hypothetical protein [Williamsoniiplasma lucivorax]|uniref:Uncharacterized protein n=1 Tax=Williamsoniiplasma lucivorax TaxID=209274 RepID=A0A2S5RDN2_9MOLU|nr:hypothetical protein [Williamsoniiplasma lucivorax]PPE05408.1 hypothetical protein ELUCI_v1c05000 [Williamsoniiplasma lucivorax]